MGARIVEQEATNGVISRLRISSDYDDWSQLRLLQVLVEDSASDAEGGGKVESSNSAEAGGPLTPITEESTQDSDTSRDTESYVNAYLQHDEEKWQGHINNINEDVTFIMEGEKD